jgi:hypothetical protein
VGRNPKEEFNHLLGGFQMSMQMIQTFTGLYKLHLMFILKITKTAPKQKLMEYILTRDISYHLHHQKKKKFTPQAPSLTITPSVIDSDTIGLETIGLNDVDQ